MTIAISIEIVTKIELEMKIEIAKGIEIVIVTKMLTMIATVMTIVILVIIAIVMVITIVSLIEMALKAEIAMLIVMQKSIAIVIKIESQTEIDSRIDIEIVPVTVELAFVLTTLPELDPDVPLFSSIQPPKSVSEEPVFNNVSLPVSALPVASPEDNETLPLSQLLVKLTDALINPPTSVDPSLDTIDFRTISA